MKINPEILQDILTDHPLCSAQADELRKAIEEISYIESADHRAKFTCSFNANGLHVICKNCARNCWVNKLVNGGINHEQ